MKGSYDELGLRKNWEGNLLKYDNHSWHLHLNPYVDHYHSSSSLFSFFFSSSCSSSCSWWPWKFVDFFYTDVNECTESTHNCRTHFFCVNTPGSFGCAYNYTRESCQGKKSVSHEFMDIPWYLKEMNSNQCNWPPVLSNPEWKWYYSEE